LDDAMRWGAAQAGCCEEVRCRLGKPILRGFP